MAIAQQQRSDRYQVCVTIGNNIHQKYEMVSLEITKAITNLTEAHEILSVLPTKDATFFYRVASTITHLD